MENDINFYLDGLKKMDQRAIARAISLVENDSEASETLLIALKPNTHVPILGVTGPPGSGKSTLVNSLVAKLARSDKRIAVLAVDPSSPFNRGSLLGDRIRMAKQFLNPNIFIRSMASRGALGGLAEKTIEITDLLRSANFDLIIVETVGVGQSELDIAGLADTTLVVLVPEAGDDVQQVKSGIMEIADIFAINKSDRPGADQFAFRLRRNIKQNKQTIPVVNIVAETGEGVDALLALIEKANSNNTGYKIDLLTEKVWRLLQTEKMRGFDKATLKMELKTFINDNDAPFNIYRYVRERL